MLHPRNPEPLALHVEIPKEVGVKRQETLTILTPQSLINIPIHSHRTKNFSREEKKGKPMVLPRKNCGFPRGFCYERENPWFYLGILLVFFCRFFLMNDTN